MPQELLPSVPLAGLQVRAIATQRPPYQAGREETECGGVARREQYRTGFLERKYQVKAGRGDREAAGSTVSREPGAGLRGC